VANPEDKPESPTTEDEQDVEGIPPESSEVDRRSVLVAGGVAGITSILNRFGGTPREKNARSFEKRTTADEVKSQEASMYVAQPGEVQTQLNAARDDGGGVVQLDSGKTYDPSETWHIWDDVTLDYRGAKVELTSDINLHRFYPTGRVVDQHVDLRGVGGYSSAVNWALNDEDVPGVVVYSEFDNQEARPWEKFPDGKPSTHIEGGRIVGSWEGGTGILLENRIPQGLHFFNADVGMKQIETGVRFRRHENSFQINGNYFDLFLDTFSVGIHQEYNTGYNTSLDYLDRTINLDEAWMNGNEFNLSTQTNITVPGRKTDWLWKIEEGKKNQLTPQPFNWDIGGYSDSNNDGDPDGWLIEDNLDQNTGNIMLDPRSLRSSFLIDQTIGSGTSNGIVSWSDLAKQGIEDDDIGIGEIEQVTASQSGPDRWHNVQFADVYNDPIAVMQPVSYEGSHPVHVRLRNIGNDSMQFQFEEWEYLDGGHTPETASYMVMEAGLHTIPGGKTAEAGSVRTDDSFANVRFSQDFNTSPVVFAQSQTFNGGQSVVARVRNLSSSGFEVRVQEAEAKGAHVEEAVGYIALEPGRGSPDGVTLETGTTDNTVTDNWQRIGFRGNYGGTLAFLAGMQTYDGSDTAGVRYRNLTKGGVEVKIEEEQSADNETGHTSEIVGYLVTDDPDVIGT
jgi:hypothetical protein